MHKRRHEGRMMQRAGNKQKASIPMLEERNSRSKRK